MAFRLYRFDGYELDTRGRELRRHDEPVALPPKSFDCLVYLIEQRTRAVGRDELISAVWGRVDVNDALLSQTLARARRAVGDTGEQQGFIRTVSRFGYQWVAPVAVVEAAESRASAERPAAAPAADDGPIDPLGAGVDAAPAAADRAPRRWRRAALVGLGVAFVAAIAVGVLHVRPPVPAPAQAPPVQSLPGAYLVRPVTVADADPAAQWIRLGVMDYLAARLREQGDRPVLPSDQVIAFLGRGEPDAADTPEARRALARATGADRVVSTVATRAGDRWSIAVEIDDAERTVRYRADAATPLQAVDRVVAQVLGRAGVAPAAADADSAARELLQRVDAAFLDGDLQQAGELIETAPPALRDEPGLAVRGAEIHERAGRMELAERQFARLAAAPDTLTPAVRGRARYGLCVIAFRRNDLDGADHQCREALAGLDARADPALLGRAYMLLGAIADGLGRYDEAMAYFGRGRIEWRRAGSLQGEASLDVNEGLANFDRGRYAEAVAAFDRAAATFARLKVYDNLASALAAKSDAQRMLLDAAGAVASSAEAWKLAMRIESAPRVRSIGFSRAMALLAAGQLSEAARVIERFDAAAASAPPEFAILRSQVLAGQGRWDEALAPAEATIERVLTPQDPTSDATLSYAVAVFADAALGGGRLDLAARLLARLRAAGPSAQDPARGFVATLGEARLAAQSGEAAAADTGFAAALTLALEEERPDQVVQAAAAYTAFLLAHGRLDEATEVAGRLARHAERDYDAARTMAALYEGLGEARSAAAARTDAARLAGERGAAAAVP